MSSILKEQRAPLCQINLIFFLLKNFATRRSVEFFLSDFEDSFLSGRGGFFFQKFP